MGGTVLAFREVEREGYGRRGTRHWSGEAHPGPRGVPELGGGSFEPEADPAADPDFLEALGDEIVTLAAHIHAATCRFLRLIARFDRLEGWVASGHSSCAHWLHFRTGLSLGTAREHVRVARAMEVLPETTASMARGRLSFSKVRALTRAATPENETDLLELAEGSTTAQLERMVRGWKKASRHDETAAERIRHRARTLSVFPDDDGMYVVRGLLEPEVGALLMRAVEAASDALYRDERDREAREEEAREKPNVPEADPADPSTGERPSPFSAPSRPSTPLERRKAAARRRADAIGLLAERAMQAGFGGRGENEGDEAGEDAGEDAPISGCRAERYQVVLHVDAETLSEDREPGRSELEDGTRVSAETSRRLSCDAALIRVEHGRTQDANGEVSEGPAPARGTHAGPILSVGRRTRTIPPALRRALDIRDRGCRFPGCGLRFTDAHHVRHWADGGETSLENCVLLCRHHHRLVHEGGWTLEWWGPGRAVFRSPKGGVHFDPEREEASWRRERDKRRERDRRRRASGPGRNGHGRNDRGAEGSLSALLAANRARGVYPGPLAASARWKRERDIPDGVWFRALEAGIEGAARFS